MLELSAVIMEKRARETEREASVIRSPIENRATNQKKYLQTRAQEKQYNPQCEQNIVPVRTNLTQILHV